jgi:GNAT superfamily N-acetyltransferase
MSTLVPPGELASAPGRKASRLRGALKSLLGPAKRKCQSEIFWVNRLILFATVSGQNPGSHAETEVTFRFAAAHEIDQLSLAENGYDTAGRLRARCRLAAGDKLVLGIHEGRAVFSSWLMFGQLDLNTDRLLPMSPDRVFSNKGFTSPSFRGRGIFRAYHCFAADWIAAQGYRELVCSVRADNAASLNAHRRMGCTALGSYYEIRLGKTLRYFVPPSLRNRLAL